MKLLSIQPPYPGNLEECETTFAFILDALRSCDAPNGIILTPEYSNAAGPLPPAEFSSFALARAEALRNAACEAGRRNQAIVILSYAKPVGDGRFRNATEAIGRDGTSLGVYFKQHLTPAELATPGMDGAYSKKFNPMPIIVSDDGLRMGFISCYDVYFDEFIMRLAAKRPDVVFVSSFQRSERQEIIRKQSSLLAFNCGSFVLRSSFSMGASANVGGCSLAVSPEGSIIADMGNKAGVLECEVANLRQKYLRSYCHGGALIDNNQYIALGRAPWSYRSCGCATIPGDRQQPFPRLCAHRGFSRACPENTLPAFGTAIALGACEIELDVRFTKDGVPVSCHDDRLDRIANGSGRVADITFEEYRQLRYKVPEDSPFAGLRLASLEEILAKFSRQTIINMHIKTALEDGVDAEYPADNLRKILALIDQYDWREHVYFMSDHTFHRVALQLAPDIPRCMSATPDPAKIVERAMDWHCDRVQFFMQWINQDMIDRAHAQGIRCNYFYCDKPEELAGYLKMGVDTILTNNYLALANQFRCCTIPGREM